MKGLSVNFQSRRLRPFTSSPARLNAISRRFFHLRSFHPKAVCGVFSSQAHRLSGRFSIKLRLPFFVFEAGVRIPRVLKSISLYSTLGIAELLIPANNPKAISPHISGSTFSFTLSKCSTSETLRNLISSCSIFGHSRETAMFFWI